MHLTKETILPKAFAVKTGDVTSFDDVSNTATGYVVSGSRGSEMPRTIQGTGTALWIAALTFSTAEPVIPGTKVPAYRVSALLDGGLSPEQVVEDFPSLTVEQINWARDYARRWPNLGKQYSTKSLKRVLRKSGFHRLQQALAKTRGRKGVVSAR